MAAVGRQNKNASNLGSSLRMTKKPVVVQTCLSAQTVSAQAPARARFSKNARSKVSLTAARATGVHPTTEHATSPSIVPCSAITLMSLISICVEMDPNNAWQTFSNVLQTRG
jgi:hypothetical protein